MTTHSTLTRPEWCARRRRLARSRGRADLRPHGATHGRSWRQPGYALRGDARYIFAERNGPDVSADECLPFGAMAEADLQPRQRRRQILMLKPVQKST